MPNHVQNLINFDCEEERYKEIVNFMKSEDSAFDFNRLIPMPEHIFRGNLGMEEREKYGADNWYDWSIQNWGTKWNAYDVYWGQNDDQLVCFSTAWASVPNIVLELSRIFPDVDMEYNWADEDIGYNVGRLDISNGKIIDEFIPEGGTREAYELAFDIQGCEDMFEYDEDKGTYVYCEE